MKRLLQIEFIKLSTCTGFWVPATFWIILYLFSIFVIPQLFHQIFGLDTNLLFSFPVLWNSTAWIASWFNLILAIMIMILANNDLTYRMFRQHIIDGLSRMELFKAKILLIIVFALSGVIVLFVCTLILGIFYNTAESWSRVIDTLYLPAVYFIQAVAYMSIGLMLVLLFRNIALSILTFLLYFFIVEPLVRLFFSQEVLVFFPMKVISNLTPLPEFFQFSTQPQFTTTINGQIVNSPPPPPPFELPLWGNTLVAVGYITLFLGISWWILKKKKL